jgi:hypothetical protein
MRKSQYLWAFPGFEDAPGGGVSTKILPNIWFLEERYHLLTYLSNRYYTRSLSETEKGMILME